MRLQMVRQFVAVTLIGLGVRLLRRAAPCLRGRHMHVVILPGPRVLTRRPSRAHRVPGGTTEDIVGTLLAEVSINGKREWL